MEARKNKPGQHKNVEAYGIEGAIRAPKGIRIDQISVMITDQQVILKGKARSFNDKLRAAEIAQQHPNAQGKTISNQIQVVTS